MTAIVCVPPEIIQANALLIAASPIMYSYIEKMAARGDKDAAEIINTINE